MIGILTSLNLDYGKQLMYDNLFSTFVLMVLHQPLDKPNFKKECLWVLSNILGGPSEHNFDIILENKGLLDLIVAHAHSHDYQTKKEALVVLYNLCENHQNRYMVKVMGSDPAPAFFGVLKNYFSCDPYLLKLAISFCSVYCQKYGMPAIKIILQESISEMIENIQYKFADNTELVQIAKDFLEKNIYVHEEIGIEEELSGAQLTDIKDGGDTGMTFSI